MERKFFNSSESSFHVKHFEREANNIAGAAAGAAIGSIVPGVGTAIGGVVGGAVDFVTGLFPSGPDMNQRAKDYNRYIQEGSVVGAVDPTNDATWIWNFDYLRTHPSHPYAVGGAMKDPRFVALWNAYASKVQTVTGLVDANGNPTGVNPMANKNPFSSGAASLSGLTVNNTSLYIIGIGVVIVTLFLVWQANRK